ncbi:MAG: heme exporter protein CcmD [Coxiellaceae bacterium]|nr:MAG: heme exporter protein CcmD [Coxiellaceae bacterium]
MAAFLAMGSYGNYVWTAYALAAAMLIGQALHAFWEHKN